jgi:hypothetical protein
VKQGDTYRLVSFDVGNFRQAWRDGEEVLLIIEVFKDGRGYYSIMNFSLNQSVDVQVLGEPVLVAFDEPGAKEEEIKGYGIDRRNIIGYSIYRNDKRLNDQVLERGDYSMERNVHIRPVFRGGYETVYSSQSLCHSSIDAKSLPTVLKVLPNPFTESIVLSYYIPRANKVELQIYDVSGRLIRRVCSEMCNPGHHVSVWDATDDTGKSVPVGIYFARFTTSDYESIKKLILLR